MPNNNTTLDLHKTLALEIKSAKKRMFKAHREGTHSLRVAADIFCVEMAQRFAGILPREGTTVPTPATEPQTDWKARIDPLPWVECLTGDGDPEKADALFNLFTYTVAVTEHGDAMQNAVLERAITEAWKQSEVAYDLRRKLVENMETAVINESKQVERNSTH